MIYVFPAPAGVIPEKHDYRKMREGFPRTCGGDPGFSGVTAAVTGFSPHLRG